jgi:hypothetical protein
MQVEIHTQRKHTVVGQKSKPRRSGQSKNEGLTEQLVYKAMNRLGYYDGDQAIIVEPKKSAKPQIQKLLTAAS